MTTYQNEVANICNEVYGMYVNQILIDHIQEEIEPLLHKGSDLTGEDIGAACYMTSILLEVYNPDFKKDFDVLSRLDRAMELWNDDYEATNKVLGLAPCN